MAGYHSRFTDVTRQGGRYVYTRCLNSALTVPSRGTKHGRSSAEGSAALPKGRCDRKEDTWRDEPAHPRWGTTSK